MLSIINTLKKHRVARSLLSVVLAITVLCSALSMVALIPAFAEYDVWDGTLTAPANGGGTSGDPYEISNGSELAYVIKNGGDGKYYELTNDIYLNDPDKVDWLTGTPDAGYTPNTWYGDWAVTAFNGTVNGNGHTVNGIYYEKEPQKQYTNYYGGVGLFSKVSSLTVKNLAVDNSYIHQEASVSAFVASTAANGSFNIDSCYAGANVYLKAAAAGAITGYAYRAVNSSVTNCYSLATVDGVNYSGLAAFNWFDTATLVIKNCYNTKGAISSHGDTSYYGTIENTYETVASGFNEGNTVRSDANMKGADVFSSAAKMPGLNTDDVFKATDSYPALKVFDAPAGGGSSTPTVEIWDGTTQTAPTDSDDDGVYEIDTAAKLAYVIDNHGTIGGTAACSFILTNDIYLNDINAINWADGTLNEGYEDYEHLLLPYGEAMKALTFKSAREMLRKANAILTSSSP